MTTNHPSRTVRIVATIALVADLVTIATFLSGTAGTLRIANNEFPGELVALLTLLVIMFALGVWSLLVERLTLHGGRNYRLGALLANVLATYPLLALWASVAHRVLLDDVDKRGNGYNPEDWLHSLSPLLWALWYALPISVLVAMLFTLFGAALVGPRSRLAERGG